MKKLEFENTVAKIYSNEENSYLFLEWRSTVVHEEFVDVCERFARIITEKKLKNGIYDIRLLGALSEASVRYSHEILLPALEPLNLQKLATLVPADVFDKMISDNMMENFKEALERNKNQNRAFNNLEDAEAWIKSPDTI